MKTRMILLLLSIGVILLLISVGCAPAATPQVIEKVVTQEVERVVTKEVEKQVVVTVEVPAPAEAVAAAPPAPAAEEYVRSETLYTGGTQWGPPTGFNPWNLGNYAMGTFGLCYEPLFTYDPLADEFTPWLAESGKWTSDNVALGMVLQGQFDLNNNFLPGISRLVEGGYGVQTYYPGPPYHLSANTAWLLMNLPKQPMDDPAFRQAAYAIDVDQIVNVVYGGMVLPANPTGLLPTWEKYIDQAVVDELGFSYDPEKAIKILTEAGYKDVNGDGFVEAPDGSTIELKINNPNGWTDWMESNRVIVNGLQAVGINAQSNFPDFPEYVSQRNEGTFDMMIANDAQIANTPWRYYLWMGRNPIEDIATMQDGNYGRYDNQEVFDLTDQLDMVPTDDIEGMQTIISKLQRIYLTDMPLIPLWYNGMWAQYNNTHWTNWPSSAGGAPHWTPVTWRGYWDMTAIRMLTDLEPAAQPAP